tara:strand:- start:526 stop:897 length:372 start_codon:yes stop_codon:yes gene_type:complete
MAYKRNQKHKNQSSTNYKGDRKKKTFRKKLGRHEFFLEGNPNGVNVPDESPGTLERALKYLKRQMKDSDTIGKFRSKQEYIKPSFKKRVLKNEAIRKNQYHLKMEKLREKGYVWTTIVNGKAY